jgi:hypothetical protein
MSFDTIIDMYNRPPVIASAHLRNSAPRQSLLASAFGFVDKANEKLSVNRKILRSTIEEIVRREHLNAAIAERAVLNFISTTENPNTNTPTVHTDLLHPGHPLSTSEGRSKELISQFFSSDIYIKDVQTRTLLASAIMSDPASARRKFYAAQLSARDSEGYCSSLLGRADLAINSL